MSNQGHSEEARESRWGEKISAVSSVFLFGFMFLNWFSSGLNPSLTGNAWQTLDVIPIVLVLGIIAAIGVFKGNLGIELRVNGVKKPKNTVVFVAGLVAMAMITFRIFFPPSLSDGAASQPRLGIFLSLIAAAGIAVGGNRAMHKETILIER